MWKRMQWVLVAVTMIQCKRDPEPGGPSPAGEEPTGEAAAPFAARVRHVAVTPIVDDVANGVATVPRRAEGEVGAPIIVLEEDHSSRAVQLQEAMILEKLHAMHGLQSIGLEGYMAEQEQLDRSWYNAGLGDDDARLENGIAFVKDGDLGSAEFMFLLHSDVNLVAVEHEADYKVPSCDLDARSLVNALITRGVATLPQTSRDEINTWPDPSKPGQKQDPVKRLVELIQRDSTDPWVRQNIGYVLKLNEMFERPIEDQLAMLTELKAGGNADCYSTFLAARSRASETMVHSIEPVADATRGDVVALIVGAGHSKRVGDILAAAHRPFAVVRPNAMKGLNAHALDDEAYKRHVGGRPVRQGTLESSLVKAFPVKADIMQRPQGTGRKRPRPVLQQQWVHARSELYEALSSIGDRLLARPNVSSAHPALGFADSDLKGKLIYIDPSKIEILAEGGQRVALFPVVLNPDDPGLRRTIWVKTRTLKGKDQVALPAGDQRRVEAGLKRALDELTTDHGDGAEHGEGRPRAEHGKEKTRAEHGKEKTEAEHGKEKTEAEHGKEKTGAEHGKEGPVVPTGWLRATERTIAVIAETRESAKGAATTAL